MSKLWSKERRINNLYKIVDKNWNVVKFRLNKAQKRLFDIEKELRQNKGKVWLKILKARQIWFTTYKLVDKLDKAIFYSNTTVNIVAHKRDKLQDIFDKVKFMYEQIPNEIQLEDWKIWKKPEPKYDNRNEYYFPEKNSRIKITLDSRSWTLTDCHISEWAFIDHFRDMLRATIPAAENADITIETTANGMNEFKDFRDNDDRFVMMFFPRFEQEEYQEVAPVWYKVIDELKYLQDKYNLTDNQMFWYEQRYKNDRDWTLQEYPSEPIDAFISSWHPFYDLQRVKNYNINNIFEIDKVRKWLKRYKNEPRADYIIWIDFAEWLEHWDKTTIRVRDRKLKLVCTYRWTIEPWDVAKIVDYLYKQWIKWIIAPERNNHWHTFLYAAKSYDRYSDIYQPKQDKNDIIDLVWWKRWWLTNMVTRPLMLDEHKKSINDWLLEMDNELRDECLTFVVKNWKPQADENCHDDVIMADAICVQMLKETPKTKAVVYSTNFEY